MIIVLDSGSPRRRQRPRPLSPFRGQPRLRAQVERALLLLTTRMKREVAAVALSAALPGTKSEQLYSLLESWGGEFKRLGDDLARRLAGDTDLAGKQHFMAQARRAMGVSVAITYDEPRMKRVLDNAAVAAATYIRTIPQQHLGKVAMALVQQMRQEPGPGSKSLQQKIREIGGITTKRARFIARDQFHKVVAAVDEAQQKDLGVKTFIWRSSEDEKVVGNPAGLYPSPTKQHGDHYKRNGKTFRWDKLPEDGPPGQAPGCRCYAEAIINFNAIQ